MRQDWDQYFLTLAKQVSTRSTCKRAQHGAIIVQDRAIVSTGYNGAPRAIQSCDEREVCMRHEMGVNPGEKYELCHAVHAEQNAICLAASNGNRVKGATIYVTGLPCLICTRMIINAGIMCVVYIDTGRYDKISLALLVDAGLSVVGHSLGSINE